MRHTIDDAIGNLANPSGKRPRRDVRALAEHLAGDARFAGCTVDELADLVRAGTAVSVPAHWAFLQQGEPAHDLYLVLTGNAEVFRQRHPVAAIGAGDIVGEIALLRGGERTATVTSTDAIKALRVDYGRLEPVLARRPALRNVIAGIGAKRIGTAA
jgi:CRP/FNR family transcriptional regulator, cyclic AMP receptor protein